MIRAVGIGAARAVLETCFRGEGNFFPSVKDIEIRQGVARGKTCCPAVDHRRGGGRRARRTLPVVGSCRGRSVQASPVFLRGVVV